MVGPYFSSACWKKDAPYKTFFTFHPEEEFDDVRKFVFLKKVTVDKLKDLLLTLLLSSNSPVAMETFCVTYLSFH